MRHAKDWLAFWGAWLSLLWVSHAGGQTTPADELVMYAVEGSSHELIRYGFGTQSEMTIGALRYPDGTAADGLESLAFIPEGPHKGLWGVDNVQGNDVAQLVAVNPLDASVTPTASPTGFGNVEGMVGVWDATLGQWFLYALHTGDVAALGDCGGLQVTWSVDGAQVAQFQPAGAFIAGFGWWNYQDEVTSPGGVELTYDLNITPDGFVGGSFALENTTPQTLDIELELCATIATPLGNAQLNGSAALGFTTDGGGGTLGLLGSQPLWVPVLDGADQAATSLFAEPFGLQLPGLGSTGSVAILGSPTPVPGSSVADSFGIRVAFSLTAFDQVSITSVMNMIGGPIQNKNLVRIDPATGQGELVMELGTRYQGLARGQDGTFYATRDSQLWSIDASAGTKSLIGMESYGDVKALEFAFGDVDPAIDVPGVNGAWTASGALFGYSRDSATMVIFDPASGQSTPYATTMAHPQLQGIVFMTRWSDPYGDILASVRD